jgi:hypothetical protein
MTDNVPESGGGDLPDKERRQVFFLGLGLYGGIFLINVVFVLAYDLSKPHIAFIRILDPIITVVFTIADSIFLRGVCRKQYPAHPELLARWPIKVAGYPTWSYYFYLLLSLFFSVYLLSRL